MRSSTITAHEIKEQPENSFDRSLPTIVLLRAGELVPEATKKFGTYHDVFSLLFQNSLNYNTLTNANPVSQLQILSYNVVQSPLEIIEYPSPDVLDLSLALIISGSASNAFDDIPWIQELIKFTKNIITNNDGISEEKNQLKLIGICFGHQIISIALGSETARNPLGWELGIDEIKLTEWGQTIFSNDKSNQNLQQNPNSHDHTSSESPVLNLYQIHRDIVTKLPASTYNLGTSKKCEIQGLVKFKANASQIEPNQSDSSKTLAYLRENVGILTLQAHPEYQPSILSDLLNARTRFASDFSIIDRQTFDTANLSLRKHPLQTGHHGPFIGFKILQILNIL